ncbi:MAG TPA: hypothetical protein VLA77_02145 [Candidatus Saccharimonadales bacterium]|nr:hypothetical protein [Candidatus Saccharimonadales bacterium]
MTAQTRDFAEISDKQILEEAMESGETIFNDLFWRDLLNSETVCITVALVDALGNYTWLGSQVFGDKVQWDESKFNSSPDDNFWAYAGGKAITSAVLRKNTREAREAGDPLPVGGLDWNGGVFRAVTFGSGDQSRHVAVAVGTCGVQGDFDEVISAAVVNTFCAVWLQREAARAAQK